MAKLSFGIFVVGLLVLQACSGAPGNNSSGRRGPSPTLAVEAVVLEPSELEEKIATTGTIFANEEVELKSEISGRVVGIYFQEGSRVKKGTLLVKLDDSDLKAQLKKLLVEENYARQDSSRQAQLMEVSATTQEVFDAAMNRLKTAQADMALVSVQIDKTEIRAPFSGVIGLRQISEGSYLTPSNIISVIQEVDPIKIEFKVSEKYASQVKPGMEISYTVTSSDKLYTASVYAVEPKIDFDTRTVAVRAKSRNPGMELFPGGFAEIEIILDRVEDALVVPSQAVIPDLNGQIVYLSKSGKVRQVSVDIGVRMERTTQLTAGVSPMDTVITTGLLQVRENMPIRIKEIKEIEND